MSLLRVRELLPSWPPGVWASSYSGAELTAPDVANAIIDEAIAKGQQVYLLIRDRGRTYSTAIPVPVGKDPARVANAILIAKGKTLNEAGDLEIE